MSLLSPSFRPRTVLAALLVLLGVISVPVTAASQEYSLTVLGKAVTVDTKDDILGDGSGSVKFDPETRTLTLTNATIQDEKVGTAISSPEDLTIKVVGENIIHIPGTQLPTGYEVDRVGITANGLIFAGDGTVDISIAQGQVVKKSHAIVAGAGGVVIDGPMVGARSGGVRYGHARGVLSEGSVTVNSGGLKAESKMSTDGCNAIASSDSVIINGGTVEAIGGHTAKAYAQDFPYRSQGISARNNIHVFGGNVLSSGEGAAFNTVYGTVTVAPELSVEVATKQDGSDVTQWDRRSSLTHDIYKHVRIVE